MTWYLRRSFSSQAFMIATSTHGCRAGRASCKLCRKSFFLRKVADHPARISCSENIRGNVSGNNASRSDRRAPSDRDPGIDDRPTANPDAVFHGNGCSGFQTGITVLRCKGVGCSIDLHRRAQKDIMPHDDVRAIQHDAIEIGVEVIPYQKVITVVAIKGWLDMKI